MDGGSNVKVKKNSTTIKVRQQDRQTWRDYCNFLGESSPRLFSKVLQSKELNLSKRILDEKKKREEDFKRKAGLI